MESKGQKGTSAFAILNVVSVVCAVVVTGLLVRREFSEHRSPGAPVQAGAQSDRKVTNWTALTASGHRMGATNGPVTILVFADFECPFCGSFATRALRGVRATFPNEVQVIFRHWPLPYHRLAYPAARAAECAYAQGRFVEFHDLLYAKQDSLGLISFGAFAKASGVRDIEQFEQCTSLAQPVQSIEADIRAAKQAGGTGTPTVLINGGLLGAVPDSAQLDSIVRASLPQHGRP